MAELVVRVALRGNMATYKWERRCPFEKNVTPDYTPPQNSGKTAEPTELLVNELKKARVVNTFEFDAEELTVCRQRFADWSLVNSVVQKALCSALPKVKSVKLVAAEPVFTVKERASRRTYTPPSGCKLVDLSNLKSRLRSIEGLFVYEVRDSWVVLGQTEEITWRELHVDVVTTLSRFCN